MKTLTINFLNTIKLTKADMLGILLLGVLAVGSGVYYNKYHQQVINSKLLGNKVAAEATSVFKENLHPIYGDATKIMIDSVGINTKIVTVGVNKDGSLETPKDWKMAGWYKDGAMPGEEGNLVINAHYDDNYGRPAAFWALKNVKVGDTVLVADSYGRIFQYRVTAYELIGVNDPDRLKVFNESKSGKITLITCGGVWIPGKATYDKRLAVSGELIR
jgi:LPXTG-site transpeptidase (sortase) family protein